VGEKVERGFAGVVFCALIYPVARGLVVEGCLVEFSGDACFRRNGGTEREIISGVLAATKFVFESFVIIFEFLEFGICS
jgi:hypothetical protein